MSTASAYKKPLPKIDDLVRPFWEHARQNKLAVQVCRECGDKHFPPTPVCSNCLTDDQEWQIVSGRGELLSWAVFHRAYWESFANDLPYPVCIVRLEEGPTVAGNLVGFGKDVPKIGDTVEAVFEAVTDEISLMRFRKVTAGPAGLP